MKNRIAKRRGVKKRITAALLCLTLVLSTPFSLTGCGGQEKIQSEDMMKGIRANTVDTDIALDGEQRTAVAEFGVQLFQRSQRNGESTLISPLSVLCALAMTANGARGNSLLQMEEAFGMPIGDLNGYLSAYMKSLPDGEKYKLKIADSIWFIDDGTFTLKQDFLQLNADYYNGNIYKVPPKEPIAHDINLWVSEKTDGMITNILDEDDGEGADIYLVNALAFDSEWEEIFLDNQVKNGVFTTERGTKQDVKMMYSTEGLYLEDGETEGFIKYYADRKYAFAALLPKPGVSVADYVSSLTGERLLDILDHGQSTSVSAAIPRFESGYKGALKGVLMEMGMNDIFMAGKADLSGMIQQDEGINQKAAVKDVLHQTFFALDEKSTKAGAAAVVMETVSAAAELEPEEGKKVCLDRPFVYLIIDCETRLPIFIGTLVEVE